MPVADPGFPGEIPTPLKGISGSMGGDREMCPSFGPFVYKMSCSFRGNKSQSNSLTPPGGGGLGGWRTNLKSWTLH